MARRAGIFALALIALVGLATAGLLIWATSESGSGFISQKLRAQLKKDTGLDVAFRNIDMDLLPPRIRVRDISANDQDGRVKCTVEEAEFAPRPLDLFAGQLSIQEVYLGVPRCTLKIGNKDVDSLTSLLKKDQKRKEPTRLDLGLLPSFDVFALSSGSLDLSVEDPGRIGSLSLKVDGFGLDVTGDSPGIEIRGLLEKASVKWNRDDRTIEEALADFRFRTALQEKAIDIRHLSADLAGASIRLRDAHLPVPLWPKGPSVADFGVDVPLDVLNRLPLDLPTMGGSAGFLGQVSAVEDNEGKVGLFARGKVNLKSASVGEFKIGSLDGQISLTPQGVAFDKVKISTADGGILARGNIAFDQPLSADISLDLEEIELARLLDQVTVRGSYVTQRMSGPIRLKGKLRPLSLAGTVDLEVKDHTVMGGSFRAMPRPPVILYLPKTSVRGKIGLTRHGFSAQGLSVSGPKTKLAVDLNFDFDAATWRLYTETGDFHLEDIKEIAGFQMGGRGPLKCLIQGPLSDPRIDGEVDFTDFAFDGKPVDRASAEVHYEDALLSFDRIRVKKGEGSANSSELRLDFDTPEGLRVSTQIEASRIGIQALARTFNVNTRDFGSPDGVLSGKLGLDYNGKRSSLYLEADLRHEELTIFGERFESDVLRADWKAGDLTVTEFGLVKGDGTISVTGAVRNDRSMNFILVASNIQADTIDNPVFKKLGIKASAQAFVIAEGTLDQPRGQADLRVSQLTYQGQRFEPTEIQLLLDGKKLTGTGALGGDKADVRSLEIDLKSKKFAVKAAVKALDVLGLVPFEEQRPKASLSITGDLSLSGFLEEKPDLTGTVQLSKVEVAMGDLSFTNYSPLNIRASKSNFKIGGTRFKGSDIVFDLSGVVGLEKVNLKVRGGANLVTASSLFDEVDKSSGILNFEVRADGPWLAPALSGKADIKEGSFKIKRFPYTIDSITGGVLLGPKGIRFNDFTARTAGGKLDVSGEMRLAEGRLADYQFRLSADELELEVIKDLTFTASTSKNGLILKSPKKGELPKIIGDVKIQDLRYTQDIRIFELADLSVDRLSGARVRTIRPKLIDRKNDLFAFDINLHGKKNLEARNNLFDINLVIDDTEKPLRLVGTNQAFGFSGQVLGTSGQVKFGGKRFDVKYATVDFRDPERPDNPYFRVTADGQIRDWKVTITAEGTVDEYEVKLTSQPYLPKEDIIVLILTGMTRAENRQFGVASLTPLLSQLGPGGSSIPLEFRVYSAYSKKAGTETTRVALGRWITPDIWVSVSSSLGQEREIAGELDYKINDRISISADYQDDNEGPVGNVGLDLKFRLEF